MSDRWPNLFVIGAMKCGTTTMHNLLAEHPQIFMSAVKEPGFFAHPHPSARDTDDYRSLFENWNDQVYGGESSTHYTMAPRFEGCAQRIATAAPHAKFIYLMKDPVSRTISHYWHQYRSKRKHGGEFRDLTSAVMTDPNYQSVSDYAFQLKPFLAEFGKEHVLPIVLEEFASNPEQGYRDILRFLQLDTQFVPANISRRDHDGRGVTTRKRKWMWQIQQSAVWSGLRRFVPASLRGFAFGLSQYDAVDRRTVCDRDARRKLVPLAEKWTTELEQLLDRDFEIWRRQWVFSDEDIEISTHAP